MRKPHIYVHRAGKLYSMYMNADNEARLRQFATVTTEGSRSDPVPPEELTQSLKDVDGILSLNGTGATEITTEVLQAVGMVKVAVISHWWHGSHDKARVMWKAAGVEVIDASDGNNQAVAEYTVAAIIMGVRRLPEFDRALKSGELWGEERGRSGLVSESTVGLLGLGRVGKWVARYLQPMGACIIAYDKYVSKEEAQNVGVRLVSLEELLRTADVVSFHLPVTDETRGMIGAREVNWIKDDAVVINAGRTAVLDNEAFRNELAKKRFRAFLDVFDEEPLPLNSPLRSMDNVFITPHIAGYSDAMFIRCGQIAIDGLRNYFDR